MRLLICGDRNWSNHSIIEDHITELVGKATIIHGAARGADTIAGIIGRLYGHEVIEFPARWNEFHRAAGPIRNTQMLVEGRPDAVWAFHNDIKHSRGTADMVRKALRAGLPVQIITETEVQRLRG